MSDAFKPRENDHLVEPMFEALREGAAPEEPAGEAQTARSGKLRWLGLVLLGLAVVALAIYFA